MSEPSPELAMGREQPVEVDLNGIPAGLTAYVMPGPDGRLPRDQKRRLKVDKVTLQPRPGSETLAPRLDPSTEKWVLGSSSRKWDGISTRFGDEAADRAADLARGGVVDLHGRVTGIYLTAITGWSLTPTWDVRRRAAAHSGTALREHWVARGTRAADLIADRDPQLAAALRNARGATLPTRILIHAAEDLHAGLVHEGPRAFSQTHFGDTKKREDVHKLLADAGATSETLMALGISRSPYIGLAGPISVITPGGTVDLSAVSGPVQFRITTEKPLTAQLNDGRTRLLIVENLQAAESMNDRHPTVPVVYHAGQPPEPTMALIARLATAAEQVLIAPDADLGGVLIARRILRDLQGHPAVDILDVGTAPHPRGDTFGPTSLEKLKTLAASGGAVGAFAEACRARGYRVEQEATIRAALNTAMPAQL